MKNSRPTGFCCALLLFTLVGTIHCATGTDDTDEPADYDDFLQTQEASINSTYTRLGKRGSTILCYIGSWANFRPESEDFRPLQHVNGSLCTHAIYAFARLCDNGTLCPSETGNSLLNEDNLSYRGVGALKRKWNNLRVGISIGGWAEGSERFSLLAASSWSRSQFVNGLIETLRSYNMTAVELAWISPTLRLGGKPYDRQNYVDLIKDVSRAIRPRGWHLGVAVKVDDGNVDAYYDLPSIARYADWLHVQAFDFHGHWEEFAGINAPLRSYHDDKKTVICPKLKSTDMPTWEQHWDNVSLTPWAIQATTNFLSFDNQRSLAEKVDFARKMNANGVAVFTLDQDDYSGDCGDGKFPLMTAVKAAVDARVAV